MKTKLIKFTIAAAIVMLASLDVAAQSLGKKNPMANNGLNYISLGLEIGPTLNQYSSSTPVHFGLPLKVYLGRQKKGRFIIRTGLHYFPVPERDLLPNLKSVQYLIIPLDIGYRRNIQDWYIEGSLGAASTRFRRVYTDTALSPTRINYREINYGIEVGRQIGDLDVGITVYNTGPIPLNILYAGIKTSYRLKW
jgi:hypothetical protein